MNARPLALAVLLGLCSCSSDSTPVRPREKLVVIGWDGATFDLIDPLLEAGRLPNLAQLIERGRTATLESTIIPISSAAWVGAVTGKGPGQTGVYSFFEPVPDSYDVQIISSRSNRAAPLWRILSAHDIGVNIFGVPVTYPPEPVYGTLVAGMLSPFDTDYAWPPKYTETLRSAGFVPDLGVWREDQELEAAKLDTQLALKERFVKELLARDNWDFSMIVFKNLDVLAHRVYTADVDGPVARLLVLLDACLGQLISELDPQTNIVLMSDHGFTTYPLGLNLHSWLVDEGYASLNEKAARGGFQGALDEVRVREHAARLGELDLSATRAFATSSEGNYGSIRLNLQGREPRGTVPAAEREAVLRELEERLRAWRVEGIDGPIVTNVFRGAELYPGPERDIVPDLMIETRPDVQVFAATSNQATFNRFARPRPDHARDGILVMAGPSVQPATERERASVLDLAPTALYLLDQPVYSEMEGEVLQRFLKRTAAPVVIPEANDPQRPPARSAGADSSAEHVRAMEQKLKALGYF